LELAKQLGVDPTYIYMNSSEGWKISAFVENIRMPDYAAFDDSKRVISVIESIEIQDNLYIP